MLCSIGVLSHTSSVSTVPQPTWMKMHMRQRNMLSMYITHMAKSGCIVIRKSKAIPWHHSSCSWLAVACYLVNGSLLHWRLSDHHSMLAASKHRSIHRPLPLNRMQEKFDILCNQFCFLCVLILWVPSLGVACVDLVLLACHDRGVWLTLFPALCGCMAMRYGLTHWLINLVGLERYTRDRKILPMLLCRKHVTKPEVMMSIFAKIHVL